MIKGAIHWAVRDTYYIQTNNPTEELLRKRVEQSRLESCGPTAAVNCLAVLGYDLMISCPGPYSPQPEEILMDWFHDPVNLKRLARIDRNVNPRTTPGNRIPSYYPLAVRDVFGARGDFVDGITFGQIGEYLRKGHALQLCLKDPGHFIAAVAFDFEHEHIIFRDPWPNRLPDGNGFNRRIDLREYDRNIKSFAVIYGRS